MKNQLMVLSLLGLAFGCGVKNSNKQTLTPSDSRVSYSTHEMALSSAATCAAYTEIATLSPSSFNSKILQATGLTKEGNLVYISYNTQYDTVRGGLDILSLSSTNTPTLISSMVSENSEFAEVKKKGNYLFMVGQRKDLTDGRNYANLAVVDVSVPASPVIVKSLDFNGYYATSIDIQGNEAFITVPNLGVVSLDISVPLTPVVLATKAIKGNSLFTRAFSDKKIVLGGSATHELSWLSSANAVSTLQSISGVIQEAPSRFTIKGNTVFSNGGNTGLTIVDKVNTATPSFVYSGGLTGTGNGITTGSCNKLFLAQGENGLMVHDVTDKAHPVLEGTFDYATDSGSANNVFYVSNGATKYVFVADGLAGVKIVKVVNSCACADDNDNDDQAADDSHEGLTCNIYDLSSNHPSSMPNYAALTPVGTFYAKKLDTVAQTYANSFPKFPTSLKTMKEWYGVQCEGYWNSSIVGASTLSLGSDDGSKFWLDDVLTINNDGQHSPATVSASMTLAKKKYKVKVEYFQGPASDIQLELKVKLNSASGSASYLDDMFH